MGKKHNDERGKNTASVLTLHFLAFVGLCHNLKKLSLISSKRGQIHFPECCNIYKHNIICAARISAIGEIEPEFEKNFLENSPPVFSSRV